MKHFHHSIAFTLNERRFINWEGQPTNEVYESENGTDPESNPASEKTESKDRAPLMVPRLENKNLAEEYRKSRVDNSNQILNNARNQIAPSLGNTALHQANVLTFTPAPVVIDASNRSNSDSSKNRVSTESPQGDTAPTAPILPPSSEATPVEPAATVEAPKPDEAKGTTQEVSIENTDSEVNAPAEPVNQEQTGEKPPETQRQALQQGIDKNVAVLKDTGATPTDKLVALTEMMGQLKDLMERAFKGTLDEKLGKDTEKATDKPVEGGPDSATANLKPAESARVKVEENAKAKEGKQTPENFNKNIDEVIAKNQVEREKNDTEIKELDKGIDGTKKANQGLLDVRVGFEKKLIDLQGVDGKEEERKDLQVRINNFNDAIASNTKIIADLDTQRDALVAQNKKLDEEDKELNRMKNDVNETLAKVTELLEQIVQLLKDQKLDTKMPKFGITLNANGVFEVSTDSKNEETSATVEVKEGGEKDLATVNELQQRKQRTILSQESSLTSEMPELKKMGGNVLSGGTLDADYWTSEDFGARYESGSGQWQIQKEGGDWQKPTEYGAADAENTNATQRLTAFNRELESIDRLIKEAQDRTEKAA